MSNQNTEYHTHTVSEDEQYSEAIIRSVAAISNQHPLSMKPLGELIDLELIDPAFASGTNNAPESISFKYDGYHVIAEKDCVYVQEV